MRKKKLFAKNILFSMFVLFFLIFISGCQKESPVETVSNSKTDQNGNYIGIMNATITINQTVDGKVQNIFTYGPHTFAYNNFGDYYESEYIPFSTICNSSGSFEIIRNFNWNYAPPPYGCRASANILIYDSHFHQVQFLWSEGFTPQLELYSGTYTDNLGNAAGLTQCWDYYFKIRFDTVNE